MALFGLETSGETQQERETINKFIETAKENLKSTSLLKNPFRGSIKAYPKKELYVISIEPLVFNYSVFGWPAAIITFIFWGFTPWVLPSLVVGCLGVFWSNKFFFFICVKGLRKAGYAGPVKLLKPKDIIRRVVL